MFERITGDTDTFAALAYGIPDVQTQIWCEQQAQIGRQGLMPEIAAKFNNSVGTVFEAIDYRKIIDTAKSMGSRVRELWQQDTIRPLTTISEMQLSPPVMVDWVMAHPYIREKYHEQSIAGYDQYYRDDSPDIHDDSYYKYREAIHGLFIPSSDPDSEEEICHDFLDEFEDSVLDFSDRVTINEAWQGVIAHIKAGKEDPTSSFNAML